MENHSAVTINSGNGCQAIKSLTVHEKALYYRMYGESDMKHLNELNFNNDVFGTMWPTNSIFDLFVLSTALYYICL